MIHRLDDPRFTQPRRAVVLGASMAGLLAARVLSENFEEVVLLERDALPAGPAPRKGTPHALQPHGLLARGRDVLEQLFPGFTATLLAQGAVMGDLGEHVGLIANRQPFARGHAGVHGIGVSRLAIEAELRRRVLAHAGVAAWTGIDAIAPVFDHERKVVTGVRFVRRTDPPASRSDPNEEVLPADLVLDCTGRASRAPQWLAAWGFRAPHEDRVDVDLTYASTTFARDASVPVETAAVIASATPDHPWPGALIAQEPDSSSGCSRWVLGVGGYHGDAPEPTLDGLRERARRIGSAPMVAVAEHGAPLGPVQRYRFAYSQRRRFERLPRTPPGLLVMGDALCSFNPVYGQGMTVAACEALALRELLAQHPQLGARAQQHWYAACARIIDTPWQLAVGGDLALPATQGRRPLGLRLTNAYMARLFRAASHDPVVALAFLRVVHLLTPPASLVRPRLLWRVLRGGGKTRPPPESRVAAK